MSNNNKTPRIGFYVCHCGHNIASVVDLRKLLFNVLNILKNIFTFIMFLFLMSNKKIFSETIHVPYDYTTIQQAVDSSQYGDTIKLSGLYFQENVSINHPLYLIGAGKDCTTIEGSWLSPTLSIVSNNVNIEKLKIVVSNPGPGWNGMEGVFINNSNNIYINSTYIYGSIGGGGFSSNGGTGGKGINVANSSFITIDSSFFFGGEGGVSDIGFHEGDGGEGAIFCASTNINISHSSISGGNGYAGGNGLSAFSYSTVTISNTTTEGGNGYVEPDGLPFYYDSTSTIISAISANYNFYPQNFFLNQNYPNPFNPITLIKYEIPINTRVILKVYNILGQEVEMLFDCYQSKGVHEILFNGSKLSSGIYIYNLQAGNYSSSRKMILKK